MSGTSVIQTGTVTPGHAVSWTTDGVAQDAGAATAGNLTSLGITNSGNLAFTVSTDQNPNPNVMFGISASATGAVTLYANSFNGAPAAVLYINLNGVNYLFNPTGGGGGGGNVIGPTSPVTSGDVVAFSGPTGTVIADSGILASSLVQGAGSSTSGHIVTFSGTTGGVLADSGVLASNVVQGPSSAVAGNVPMFSGTSGKIIVDSGYAASAIGGGGGGGGGDVSSSTATATGTTTARTIANHLGDWADVKDFGALGNGVQLDAAAFTAAAAASPLVFVPHSGGSYVLGSAVTQSTSAVLSLGATYSDPLNLPGVTNSLVYSGNTSINLSKILSSVGTSSASSANQWLMTMQATLPSSASPASAEKGGLFVNITTQESCQYSPTDILRDGVAIETQAEIYNTTTGRAWGLHVLSSVLTGADGFCIGVEIEMANSGTNSNYALDQQTGKHALNLVSDGPQPVTTGIHFWKNASTFNYGMVFDPGAITSGGASIIIPNSAPIMGWNAAGNTPLQMMYLDALNNLEIGTGSSLIVAGSTINLPVNSSISSGSSGGIGLISSDSGNYVHIGTGSTGIVAHSTITPNSSANLGTSSSYWNAVYAGGFVLPVNGTVASGSGGGIGLISSDSSNYVHLGVSSSLVVCHSSFVPNTPSTLGNSSNLWSSVWSSTGTIQTSDERLKTNIEFVYGAGEFLDDLRPITYNWKADPEGAPRAGFGAQRTREVCEAHDVRATIVIEGDDGTLHMQPDQIIPYLVAEIQALRARVKALEGV